MNRKPLISRAYTNRIISRLLAAGCICIIFAWFLASCASIGRPEGGPRDEKPPVFVRSNPMPGATNVNKNRIEAFFDENIQLDDAFNKVIVSPAQKQQPVVRSLGHRVTVELRDTLIPDATYTIDFGDAIKDLNEGNILDGFALDFSTGETIDTLRISGVLLEGHTLEPAQGMLVGIYSNLADSALSTLPLERVARTNSRGQFTVRGLKEGQYRVVAINDVNRDNRWDSSEGVAFFDTPVAPSVENIVVNDTLRDADGKDSIATRPGVAFLPADILLTWFYEDFTTHYLKKTDRPKREQVAVLLSAPTDSLTRAEIVKTPALEGKKWEDITLPQYSPGNDSIIWWIKDPDALQVDSLTLALTYPKTDSLKNVVMNTDTIRFFYRPSSQELKAAKELAKLREKGADTIPPPQIMMDVKSLSSSMLDVYKPLILKSETPWDSIDSSKLRFFTQVDTIWQPTLFQSLVPNPKEPLLERLLVFDSQPGSKYKLEIDSAAFHDIYDHPNKALKQEFTVKSLEDYSTILFTVTPADSSAIVELLDTSDKPIRFERLDNKGKAIFKYVTPGTYYARMYFDDNHDDMWTTGNVANKQQPEESAYYPKKIDARANWDVDLTWDIYQIPLDAQKPYAILKNKPKLKKGETAPGQEEEQAVDEWGNPINGNNSNGFGNFGGFGGLGGSNGLQQNNGNTSSGFKR